MSGGNKICFHNKYVPEQTEETFLKAMLLQQYLYVCEDLKPDTVFSQNNARNIAPCIIRKGGLLW